jgi:hypothetical protein
MSKIVLVPVVDSQQGKVIPMHPKRALHLATSYPNRFSLLYPSQIEKIKENIMPALPVATKALDNGLHILNVIEVKTVNGQYGPQEECVCLKEGTEDTKTRIWVPHNNLKRIKEAEKAGIVIVDEGTGSWDVIPGARFQVYVAGGKVVALTAAPPVSIQQG